MHPNDLTMCQWKFDCHDVISSRVPFFLCSTTICRKKIVTQNQYSDNVDDGGNGSGYGTSSGDDEGEGGGMGSAAERSFLCSCGVMFVSGSVCGDVGSRNGDDEGGGGGKGSAADCGGGGGSGKGSDTR